MHASSSLVVVVVVFVAVAAALQSSVHVLAVEVVVVEAENAFALLLSSNRFILCSALFFSCSPTFATLFFVLLIARFYCILFFFSHCLI